MGAFDLRVNRVTDPGDLPSVYELGRSTYTDEAQCTPGHFWPSMRQLAAVLEMGGGIYVASRRGEPLGFTTVEPSGQVRWLRARAADIGVVCAACCAVSFQDYGFCWGVVGSAWVRTEAVAADPAHFVDEGTATGILRFVL